MWKIIPNWNKINYYSIVLHYDSSNTSISFPKISKNVIFPKFLATTLYNICISRFF